MLPPFLIVMDEVVFSSSSCTYEGCRFVHELEWSQLLLCRRDGTAVLGCGTAALLICSRGVLHLCIRVVSGIWYSSNLRSFHFYSMYFLWSYIINGHFLDCFIWWILLSYNTSINLLHLRILDSSNVTSTAISTLPEVLLKTR